MNRKLHNSLSALMATGATLAIALMVAVPAQPLPQRTSVPLQLGALEIEVTPKVSRDQAAARAEDLIRRIEQGADQVDTLAEAASLTAEIATAAALAGALDASQEMDDRPSEPRQPNRARRHTRQTLVMPYFSFSPRG
ncbi:MAG TPA: hypothetical protein VGD21_15105 [Lysobacter sp.]